MNKKRNLLLTGGAGFIGSNIIQELNERSFSHIVIVDDLGSDEKWKNLVGKRFIDIVPIRSALEWLSDHDDEIETIIHLGACSSTTERDADYLLQNNYQYSVDLAKFAIRHRKRFICASSAATYGDGNLGFSDDESLLEQYHPLNMYGYSKHLFDLWAKRNKLLDQITSLKYFNVFGPGEAHKREMASAVFKLFPKILYEKKISLFKSNHPNYGDGEQKRDFIYVKDAAKMTCDFIDKPIYGVFNIGSGIASSWNELALAMMEALQIEATIEYVEMPETLKKQYQNYTCAPMEKYFQAFGSEAIKMTSLKDAVYDYINNYLRTEIA